MANNPITSDARSEQRQAADTIFVTAVDDDMMELCALVRAVKYVLARVLEKPTPDKDLQALITILFAVEKCVDRIEAADDRRVAAERWS